MSLSNFQSVVAAVGRASVWANFFSHVTKVTRQLGSRHAYDLSMPSIEEIVAAQSALSSSELAHLRALTDDWQLMADLSFSDLVLWVSDREQRGMWAVAQVRPTTGPTTMVVDVAGSFVPTEPLAGESLVTFAPTTEVGVLRHTLPVVFDGRVIAVVVRREPHMPSRPVSDLESNYRHTSDALIAMMGRGEFPFTSEGTSPSNQILRVGDGFVRTAKDGTVTWASPNALSAYRQLGLTGGLVGLGIVESTTRVADHVAGDNALADVFGPRGGETELEGRGATVLLRVIPMLDEGEQDGLVVLLRDVTELRKRERELVSKEATIREIHHRVKNNLQTVAALLRLQGRRMEIPEARAALKEAEQRVATIAIVHEILSHSFDELVPFDDVADRLLRSVLDLGGPGIAWERQGSFGVLPSEVATPLAMIVTEIVQNAHEHAFDSAGGTVTLTVARIGDLMRLSIADDGKGLPEDFDPSRSLGLSIVATLVESELSGRLAFGGEPGQGMSVQIEFTP